MHVSSVLNPAIQEEQLRDQDLDTVEELFKDMDFSAEQPTYTVESSVEHDRYGTVAFDAEKGFLEVDDAQYSEPRTMLALAFESEQDREPRDGILAVDEHGASARRYCDGSATYNGIGEPVMDTINALVTDQWGYRAVEQRDRFVADQKEYTVELSKDVEKYWDKLDGSQLPAFEQTLDDLAEEPYDNAKGIVGGGRQVYHAINNQDRLIASVDQSDKKVTVDWVGDHDALERLTVDANRSLY